MSAAPNPTPLPPPLAMLEFIHHFWASRAVYAAAKLGLADVVATGPKTAAQVAIAVKIDAPSAYRLLRALASIGIFAENASGQFEMTPMAETLRTDVPGSLRSFMTSELGEDHYPAWGGLMHSLQTGKKAFDHVFGTDVWSYYASHPETGKIFSEAMTGLTQAVDRAVLDAYDFSGFKTLLDVGGGHGGLLCSIAGKHPSVNGIVFDMPNVIEGAKKRLASLGMDRRIQSIHGDFFETIPTGADACIMKHIIHDWDDASSIRILKNVAKALPAEARLLLVETVIPPGNERHFSKFMDLNMLIMTGGRERTEAEYGRLLEAGGFRLTRIVPTQSVMYVIEAVRIFSPSGGSLQSGA